MPEAICARCGWTPKATKSGTGGGTSVVPRSEQLLEYNNHLLEHILKAANEIATS